MEETLLGRKEEVKMSIERAQASRQAQLEDHQEETGKI